MQTNRENFCIARSIPRLASLCGDYKFGNNPVRRCFEHCTDRKCEILLSLQDAVATLPERQRRRFAL